MPRHPGALSVVPNAPVSNMPQGLSPMSSADVLPHKRQVVVERLRRRMENYRRRQNDCQPRFDQTFGGLCEQNMQDTLALKQRFLETKAKRQNKTKQDKQNKLVQQVVQHQQQNDSTNAALQSSVHVQQKFLKRGNEDLDNVGGNDGMDPPVKLQCTAQHNQGHSGHQTTEGLTKFSVEIVQQLEFTTSAANSQPQQISTNVTVKALTNTSVKSDISSPKTSNPSTPASAQTPQQSRPNIGCVDIGTLVECKQEPDNDFADLDQCAAALEKDAQANGGNSFPGFSDLIGDDTSDEIITSDAFKDLISEISDLNPEFMKEFDFEEKCDVSAINLPPPNNQTMHQNDMKLEDTKDLNLANNGLLDVVKSSHSPLLQNAYSPPVYDNHNKNRLAYSNMDFPKTELSPAAQTLKQMAEQHQHKNQMGLAFNTAGSNRVPTSRSPYSDFQFNGNEFLGSPNSNQTAVAALHNKNNFPQSDLIKQELNIFNNQPPKGATGPGLYKQQYSPYNSPSANHGSPGYMPRGGGGPAGGPQGPGGPPPRPSSGANTNPQSNSTTLQINQAQQLHISQPGHGIQVSAGQHMHLSSDLKGSVSIAAQQGMYFSQQQHQQQNQPQHNPQAPPQSSGNNPHNMPVNSNGQQPPNAQSQQSNMHSSNPQQQQSQQQQRQQKNPVGPGVGNAGPQPGGPQMPQQQSHIIAQQTQQMQQQGDTYTVSQSQTINFTQQTLRQRAAAQQAAAASNKGYSGNARNQGPVQMPDTNMMQGQQHMMGSHAAMHNNMMGGCRPPPPDYKSSAALMQNGPTGYPPQTNAAPNIMRRLTQAMPPSGPMMRPQQNIPYNMMGGPGVQQMRHAPSQGYSMGTNQMRMAGGADGSGVTDWRSMMMSQQQNVGYANNQMRGMMANPGNMPQMHSMQSGMHGIQMSQGSMPGPNHMMGYHGQGMGGGSMQMNPAMMNPQMMAHQQNMARAQPNNQQIPITNINISQQQSFTMNNANLHQQQQQQQQQQQPNNPQASQLSQAITPSNPNSSSSNASNNQNNNQLSSSFPQSAPDFIDFLDNLPAGDTNNFSAQDLLNSLDSDPGFNLQDIL